MNKDLNNFEEQLKNIKNPEKIIEEDSSMVEDVEEELEDIKIITEEEEQVKETKKGNDYTKVIESMPELKQDLDYLLLTKKIEDGKQLTKKEEEFKQVYELAKQKENEFAEQQELLRQKEESNEKILQDLVDKEYEEYKKNNPSAIEIIDSSKALSLIGSDNFLKVALTWGKLIKSRKKGGKIFVKVCRPKRVSFEWTTKDVKFVEFWSTNERGDRVKEVTRVSQYNYTFDGTSIPVIFAIQGFAESYDYYGNFKKDLTSEYVSGLVMESYNLGYKDGVVIRDKEVKKNNLMALLSEYMPLILIVGLLVIGFMMYTLYGEMATLYKAVTALQEQIAITGALVVR
jgi:hypothetical protein